MSCKAGKPHLHLILNEGIEGLEAVVLIGGQLPRGSVVQLHKVV